MFYVWPISIRANFLMSGRVDDKIKDLMREAKKRTNNSALASRTREVLRVNVVEELKLCECPILYLRGARDLVVSSRNIKEIKAVNNNARDFFSHGRILPLARQPHRGHARLASHAHDRYRGNRQALYSHRRARLLLLRPSRRTGHEGLLISSVQAERVSSM